MKNASFISAYLFYRKAESISKHRDTISVLLGTKGVRQQLFRDYNSQSEK